VSTFLSRAKAGADGEDETVRADQPPK